MRYSFLLVPHAVSYWYQTGLHIIAGLLVEDYDILALRHIINFKPTSIVDDSNNTACSSLNNVTGQLYAGRGSKETAKHMQVVFGTLPLRSKKSFPTLNCPGQMNKLSG